MYKRQLYDNTVKTKHMSHNQTVTNVNSSQSDLLVAINRLYNWSCVQQLQIAVEKCFVCAAVFPVSDSFSGLRVFLELYEMCRARKSSSGRRYGSQRPKT